MGHNYKKKVYNANLGDSAVTMARIAWADGHARRAVNDWSGYERLIINPIREKVTCHLVRGNSIAARAGCYNI